MSQPMSTRVLVGLSVSGLVVSVAAAACFVCGQLTCTYTSGGPCSHPSEITVCENAPRDANPGESGYSELTQLTRPARCWSFLSSGSGYWYQGPCSAGPPSGTWYSLGSCGLSTGTCCWTSIKYQSFAWTPAGFQMKDCLTNEEYRCVRPWPWEN